MLLAEDVDEEKIHARYQDGILEVILEGAAAVREPKRIQIEVLPSGQQGATDVEVSEVGREVTAPTTARPEEGAQGTAPPGDVPPETPPETRLR
jgi:hypothetical protein